LFASEFPSSAYKFCIEVALMSISGISSNNLSQYALDAASRYQQPIQQAGQNLKSGSVSGSPSNLGAPTAFSLQGSPTTPPVVDFPEPVRPPFTESPVIQGPTTPPGFNGPEPVRPPLTEAPAQGLTNTPPVFSGPEPVRSPFGAQNLTAGNLSSAQQAYAALLQDPQLLAFGSGALASESSILLAPLSLEV
jgi:hypothetical protein